MNGAGLQALFAEHKTAVLGAAAAAVAGLALLQRKKAAAAGGAGATTVGATVPGTLPAAAVIPAGGSIGGGYDSSSYDLYNALQPEISQILQQQQAQQTGGTTGGGVTAAPAPIASTLFAPTYNGNYVHFTSGETAEVESDGSLYNLTQQEGAHALGKAGWRGANQLDVAQPKTNVFSASANLLRQAAGAGKSS